MNLKAYGSPRRVVNALASLLSLSAALSCAGGAEEEDSASICPNFDYVAYSLQVTPAVQSTFRADVEPIFRASCAFSGCHDALARQRAADLSLGTRNGEVSSSSIHSGLFRPSNTAPSLWLVKPYEPENSFIMNKLQGNLDCANVTCVGSCGLQMPQPNPPLDEPSIERIRNWIAAGARDD